jgi:hypothetical protein
VTEDSAPPEAALPASEETTYQPRQPLWQSGRKEHSSNWRIALGIAFAIVISALVVGVSMWFLLETPVGQVEATIVRVERGSPPGEESPGVFWHLVTLPDGTHGRFVSDRVHPKGERLFLTEYRNRLTGRRRFAGPYRVLTPTGR